MQPIPPTLAPFFQEYDFVKLNPQVDSFTIIERILQFGNRTELRWLFNAYPHEQIMEWVTHYGNERLPQPHRTFWKVVLDIKND
jgi:hypothetical protein